MFSPLFQVERRHLVTVRKAGLFVHILTRSIEYCLQNNSSVQVEKSNTENKVYRTFRVNSAPVQRVIP